MLSIAAQSPCATADGAIHGTFQGNRLMAQAGTIQSGLRAPERAGETLASRHSFTILPMIRLENVLNSWRTIRQDTAQAVEELFSGLLDELAANGAAVFDGTDLSKLYFCMNGHVAIRTGTAPGIRVYNATRPCLECHVRRRVRAIPNVTFLDGHDVIGDHQHPVAVTYQRRHNPLDQGGLAGAHRSADANAR